ncbi:MAG: hypothetical protein P1U56_15040 [Saprospiraceae bacterium]|nr:hypothetical protein [Saprospiraceae bacterium]
MNKIVGIKEVILAGEKFKDPVFEINDDLLINLFRYSSNEVDDLFLNKLNKIRLATSINEHAKLKDFEVRQDEILEYERELPVHIREDTGFKLGRLIHLQSYIHSTHLYYRIESDEIVLLQYLVGYETRLRLFNSKYFINLCNQWKEQISKT